MAIWISFIAFVMGFLALDLGVFNRKPHTIHTREASRWTLFWVALSFAFSGIIYLLYGHSVLANPNHLRPLAAVSKYITGYLIELSLSIDNIFVIAIIFRTFRISQKYQHRVLFWGIIGAIIFRGLMIFGGVYLINKVDWITYVFGVFLIFTGVRMLFTGDESDFDPKHSLPYRIVSKLIPTTSRTSDKHFFLRVDGKRYATPLFVALIVIEVMDVLFAVDSVPAILAITTDPFLVFSSNIFAILGLRSMYFFLARMIDKFAHLEYSLVAILIFVGVKMLLKDVIEVPEWAAPAFIALSLAAGIFFSMGKQNNKT